MRNRAPRARLRPAAPQGELFPDRALRPLPLGEGEGARAKHGLQDNTKNEDRAPGHTHGPLTGEDDPAPDEPSGPHRTEPGMYPFERDAAGMCDRCDHITLHRTAAGRWVHQACTAAIPNQ